MNIRYTIKKLQQLKYVYFYFHIPKDEIEYLLRKFRAGMGEFHLKWRSKLQFEMLNQLRYFIIFIVKMIYEK